MSRKLEILEEEGLTRLDKVQVPPPEIVAYNELRSCADLFRMSEQGILNRQPEFQREVVWQGPAQTRFIDSLIKQLPIPSMCFALDHKQQKWIVIDGLQRISTIIRFLKGGDWKLSKLDDIDPAISGKLAATIKDNTSSEYTYYTRVENLTIPITVLRCDFNNESHMEYLFTIFHRLNTGAMRLNNQEIRNCIYSGKFNKLLIQLDKNPFWRRINKMKSGSSYRFTKQELILRFFAFEDSFESYNGYLANFLNEYMFKFRNPTQEYLDQKEDLFRRTINFVWEKVFKQQTPPKTPITILEGILVGVGRNIDTLENVRGLVAQSYYSRLRSNDGFSESALTEGLSKKPKVLDRLNLAVRNFRGE